MASSSLALKTSVPPKIRGGSISRRAPTVDNELSVFDVLNIFRRRWFLSRANLVSHIISAQKAEDGKISWAEFDPPYHSHLVKCAVALVPRPVLKAKKAMFVYILELLNNEDHLIFFDLQKGSRKANNAQKEKRRLARKRSRAAKREREREAAKVADLPSRKRECLACGRKFKSRKTAKKHKCSPKSKVVREKGKEAGEKVLRTGEPAEQNKPAPTQSPPTPTAPSYSNVPPPVTGGLEDRLRAYEADLCLRAEHQLIDPSEIRLLLVKRRWELTCEISDAAGHARLQR